MQDGDLPRQAPGCCTGWDCGGHHGDHDHQLWHAEVGSWVAGWADECVGELKRSCRVPSPLFLRGHVCLPAQGCLPTCLGFPVVLLPSVATFTCHLQLLPSVDWCIPLLPACKQMEKEILSITWVSLRPPASTKPSCTGLHCQLQPMLATPFLAFSSMAGSCGGAMVACLLTCGSLAVVRTIDVDWLQHMAILDEAHQLKNSKTEVGRWLFVKQGGMDGGRGAIVGLGQN